MEVGLIQQWVVDVVMILYDGAQKLYDDVEVGLIQQWVVDVVWCWCLAEWTGSRGMFATMRYINPPLLYFYFTVEDKNKCTFKKTWQQLDFVHFLKSQQTGSLTIWCCE